jgi:hypothetical protein
MENESNKGIDPFTPEALRLPQSFTETVNVKQLLRTVPCRKPGPQEFVRVHPAPEYRTTAALLTLKDDREHYLVTGTFAAEIPNEVVPATLFLTITRQRVVAVWPVRLPGPDGKDNQWWASARDAAAIATNRWVRIKANSSLGGYDVAEAEGAIPDPEWPELSFFELLRICFRDRMVTNHDHPVLKKLRGL